MIEFFKNSTIQQIFWIFFGLSSWIACTSTFTQITKFNNTLPEGNKIASIITILIQIGNICPILILIINKYKKISDVVIIYIILSLGCIAIIGMVFFWNTTTIIGGVSVSIGLYIFVLILACCDCSSNIVYWPLAARYQKKFILALQLGGTLGGGIASIFSLVSESANMTVSQYFCLIFSTAILSFLGFIFIQKYGTGFMQITMSLLNQQNISENSTEKDSEVQNTSQSNSEEVTLTPVNDYFSEFNMNLNIKQSVNRYKKLMNIQML